MKKKSQSSWVRCKKMQKRVVKKIFTLCLSKLDFSVFTSNEAEKRYCTHYYLFLFSRNPNDISLFCCLPFEVRTRSEQNTLRRCRWMLLQLWRCSCAPAVFEQFLPQVFWKKACYKITISKSVAFLVILASPLP